MNAVDTNVLVYACDRRDPAKQAEAMALIKRLTDGVLLWQVATEFIAVSRKLAADGFTPDQAWRRLAEFASIFPLVVPSPSLLPVARRLHIEEAISFWDAMLYGACLTAGVKTLYSEDIPGCVVSGLTIHNPFAPTS